MRQSQDRTTLFPTICASNGPGPLIQDSGLHSLRKRQVLLDDRQRGGNNGLNRLGLRLALLRFEPLDGLLVPLNHVLHVRRIELGATHTLKSRHLLFCLLTGRVRQLDPVLCGNGGELALQRHVVQHNKPSKRPNGRGLRLLLGGKSALNLRLVHLSREIQKLFATLIYGGEPR